MLTHWPSNQTLSLTRYIRSSRTYDALRSFAALAVLSLSTNVNAQSYWSLTWSVSGYGNVSEVTLDVSFTNRFMTANGAISSPERVALPLSGTCIETTTGTLCSLFASGGTILLFSLDKSLNGVLRELNSLNIVTNSGVARLVSVKNK